MMEVINSEHKTNTVIDAYDRWLVLFDTLIQRYNELSKMSKFYKNGIKLNLRLTDLGTQKYKIFMNMLQDNEKVIYSGLELEVNDFYEYLYLVSHIIDKYLKTLNNKIIYPSLDETSIEMSTAFSDLKITGFFNRHEFDKVVGLFINEFSNYKMLNSNNCVVSFYKGNIRKNKEANSRLLSNLDKSILNSESDIDFDNVKSLKK